MKPLVRRHTFAFLALRRPSPVAGVLVCALLSSMAGGPGTARVRAIGQESRPEPVVPGPQLVAVSGTLGVDTTTITIEASDPVPYVMSQPDPFTVVVDLRTARMDGAANNIKGRFGLVAGASLERATMSDGTSSARIRLRLTDAVSYNVRSARNIIVVEVGKLGAASKPSGDSHSAALVPASTPTPPPAKGVVAVATELSGIKTSLDQEGAVVTLTGNGRLAAAHVEEVRDGAPRLVVELPNVTPAVPAQLDVRKGPIERISVTVASRKPLLTRVILDLNKRAPYWVQPPEDDSSEFRIVVENQPDTTAVKPIFRAQIGSRQTPPLEPMTALTLRNPGSDPATVPAVAPPADVQPTVRGVASTSAATTSSLPIVISPVAAPAQAVPTQAAPAQIVPVQSTPTAAPTPPVAATSPPPQRTVPAGIPTAQPTAQAPRQAAAQPPVVSGRTYSGSPVTLDFQGSDLRAVLRTFAEISGLNIVIDPAVQGSVDVALRDVPWDQALDIILRANKLDWEADGTIIRIAPVNVLAAEKEERRKLLEAQQLAGELVVRTFMLSYAKAEDLVPLLTRAALSPRGEVQVDNRTNTIIVRDLGDKLQTAGDLIATLDRPQPQVEIEARIVQTTREFARSLGVQWGFNGRVAQDIGNNTGLAFPNTGSLSGRTGNIQGPQTGEQNRSPASVVNLGVEGASTAIGLALGSVNGSLNLDVALSALERAGQGRLLSTPRVSTQNNVEAEITQGVQIPIQTVANNTVTVSFKDAALTLKVTPQITAANTVIMRIAVENAAPDFSRAIKDIPPIDTQRAITQVLVSDGQTTVIGGIYVSREQSAEDRTPGLHRLPLLGWLFKRESIRDESRELLIFITPRIVKV
jgi:type IV pilus assembly protein PilQ